MRKENVMCRLYVDKGERNQKCAEISAKFLLTREQMGIIEREVRKHREWQRKHGYDVIGGEYTEKDLIWYAVSKYINELREEQKEQTQKTITKHGDVVVKITEKEPSGMGIPESRSN